MSSRRSKHSSAWSKWEWNSEHQCYTRWRMNKGEKEWGYKKSDEELDNPGDSLYSEPIAESPQDAQSQYQFGTSKGDEADDDTTSQQFASMTLNNHLLPNTASSYSSQVSGNVRSEFTPITQPNRGNFMNDVPTSNWQNSQAQSQNRPPRWQLSSNISTKDPGRSYEQNDKSFKKCESKKFKFGKVFKVLWSEPQGTNGTNITTWGGSFKKIRRFVIVKNFKGHCICLPILTYGGRGTLKPGVHREDHAVIYTDRDIGPKLLSGETLSKTALRMEPNDDSQKLDKASRVNYAKVYTVEHNVKVFFIGALTKNAQAQLGADYNAQHPPIEETAPEDGYIVTRPLGRSNSSNSGQQFEQMATTADGFYGNSGMANASSTYALPEDAEPLSSYYDSNDTVSVGELEQSTGYTFQQLTGGSNYPAKGQYGIQTQGEQSEEAQTPRRAASPEEATTTTTPGHGNTQEEFPT